MDDPFNALAFNTKLKSCGARIQVIFSSDIGHWVPEMQEVRAEAYELVEKGALTAEDFRDSVFTNPKRMRTIDDSERIGYESKNLLKAP